MENKQLDYFLAVARYENMSEAARQLHVSQPSLSASVKNLEDELGTPLFTRSGRKINLNDAGRYFQKRIALSRSIQQDAAKNALDIGLKRSTCVNCTTTVPLGHIGKFVRAFNEQHPEIHLRIGYPNSSLFDGEIIDIDLFGSVLEIDDSDIIEFGSEEFVLIMPPNHRFAAKSSVSLRSLKDDPFIFTAPSDFFDASIAMCHELSFEPRIVAQLQIVADALNMVEQGIGCCIAAEFSWLAGIDQNVLIKPINDARRVRKLYARLPTIDSPPSKATWDFFDFLQDFVEDYHHSEEFTPLLPELR